MSYSVESLPAWLEMSLIVCFALSIASVEPLESFSLSTAVSSDVAALPAPPRSNEEQRESSDHDRKQKKL